MTHPILKPLVPFTSMWQRLTLNGFLMGEEHRFFEEKLKELTDRIAGMPKTYGQDGKGDDAIAYLHYFGGNYDGFITELDVSAAPDHHQAYGYARFYPDGLEAGYISLPEILAFGSIELDLHFEPTRVGDLKLRYAPT